MKTLIRLFWGEKNRGINKNGEVTAFDGREMTRLDEGKFIVTRSCAKALLLLKKHTKNKDVTIVIALTPGDTRQEKKARAMKFYYGNKLLICHVLEVSDFDEDDQILINCPISSPASEEIKERESREN